MSNTENSDKIKSIVEKIDVSFLKGENYKQLIKEQGMTYEQLLANFTEFMTEEILPERPDLVENANMDKIQETAEMTYFSYWQRRMTSRLADVLLTPLAISIPNDYIGVYKSQARKLYNEAQSKLAAGDNRLWKDCLEKKIFDENGVPLEHRVKKNGPNPTDIKRNDNWGKSYNVESSYFCNVLAYGTDLQGRNPFFFSDSLGGETTVEPMDKQVRLRCKCGEESVFAKCPKCGARKPFFDFETISRSCFHQFKTQLYIGNKDDKGEKKAVIRWTQQTTVPREKTYVAPDFVEKILGLNSVKSRIVSAEKLEDVAVANLDAKGRPSPAYWIVFIGMVNNVNKFPQTRGSFSTRNMYDISVSQKGMGFFSGGKAVGGINVHIPEHVWKFMGGNSISQWSKIVVFGHLIRELQYDAKTQKTIAGQYKTPEIIAWGFYLLEGGKPKEIIEDVAGNDSVEIDPIASMDDFGTSSTSEVFEAPADALMESNPQSRATKPSIDVRPASEPALSRPAPNMPSAVIARNQKKEDIDFL